MFQKRLYVLLTISVRTERPLPCTTFESRFVVCKGDSCASGANKHLKHVQDVVMAGVQRALSSSRSGNHFLTYECERMRKLFSVDFNISSPYSLTATKNVQATDTVYQARSPPPHIQTCSIEGGFKQYPVSYRKYDGSKNPFSFGVGPRYNCRHFCIHLKSQILYIFTPTKISWHLTLIYSLYEIALLQPMQSFPPVLLLHGAAFSSKVLCWGMIASHLAIGRNNSMVTIQISTLCLHADLVGDQFFARSEQIDCSCGYWFTRVSLVAMPCCPQYFVYDPTDNAHLSIALDTRISCLPTSPPTGENTYFMSFGICDCMDICPQVFKASSTFNWFWNS